MLARQKILAHLKKNRAVTAREIARSLKMTAPNVRHHLGVLVSDGRVELTETRLRNGKGRPENLYSLSQAVLGDNLSGLADALLVDVISPAQLEKVAGRLMNPLQFTNLPVAKRLALLVEKLNEMHYQSRWEAGPEGPRVILTRCPYAKIIEKHPELCKIDSAMLQPVFGRPVTQISKMEKTHGVCIFVLS
jgi:predicted ArsR family transcriptional regulator